MLAILSTYKLCYAQAKDSGMMETDNHKMKLKQSFQQCG